MSRTFSASAPLLLPLLSPELHIPESTNRGNLHSGGKQGFYIQRGKARRFAFRKGKQKDLLSGGKDQVGKTKEFALKGEKRFALRVKGVHNQRGKHGHIWPLDLN